MKSDQNWTFFLVSELDLRSRGSRARFVGNRGPYLHFTRANAADKTFATNQRTVRLWVTSSQLFSLNRRFKKLRHCVFPTELIAILSCISHLDLGPPNEYLLRTDSRSSLYFLTPWSVASSSQFYLSCLTILPASTFAWIPGHIGLLLHGVGDRAATEAAS